MAKYSDVPTPIPTFPLEPAATARTAVGTHMATTATPEPIAACAAALPRVVRPDRNSSHLPASSSPRSDRVAANSPQIAPRMIRENIVL